jgi:hypothetical protein
MTIVEAVEQKLRVLSSDRLDGDTAVDHVCRLNHAPPLYLLARQSTRQDA